MDNTLNQLFINSKDIIIGKVCTFDLQRHTRLQTDWGKNETGYLLLQKYCDSALDRMPTCCPEGWRLVFAESRFTSSGWLDAILLYRRRAFGSNIGIR